MKYTKATDYALHTIVFMIQQSPKENLSKYTLAEHFNVSVTYLSKIMTQLVKAGIIESVSGVNGGYILRKKAEEISFYDVIIAIEGTSALFECGVHNEPKCPIQQVMSEAESNMEHFLKSKKLYNLVHKE
ncbi:Rrf2 family transcriptional regulator [Clostridium sp. YIM B02505]|uniref:Rrf2 family transcriptional regulator n=1 Tax=Clostridium yunnanense TaxID=2800325 RepID=A0ABS1EN07_9CLOT|nr:Rrf2 family transcriptional regulator [Clostridium yunnanense]MBK1810719.1 Rrf2 family transcriptional regulator [Clostridium yunnanense]